MSVAFPSLRLLIHYVISVVPIYPGVNIRNEQDTKMQEDLAGLFSRNLTLSAPPPPSQASPFQPPTPSDQHLSLSDARPPATVSLADVQHQPITYASTHYTHSAHAAPRARSEPRTPNVERVELFDALTRNSIDPESLSLSQRHLYANSDADQRLRLLEIWRISPPNYADIDGSDGTWFGTSLHQEEQLARIRYERLMDERRMIGHANRPEDVPSYFGKTGFNMSSGYEQLAQREYAKSAISNGGDLPLQDLTRSYNCSFDLTGSYGFDRTMKKDSAAEDMENQYGMWAEVREFPPVAIPSDRAGVDTEMGF